MCHRCPRPGAGAFRRRTSRSNAIVARVITTRFQSTFFSSFNGIVHISLDAPVIPKESDHQQRAKATQWDLDTQRAVQCAPSFFHKCCWTLGVVLHRRSFLFRLRSRKPSQCSFCQSCICLIFPAVKPTISTDPRHGAIHDCTIYFMGFPMMRMFVRSFLTTNTNHVFFSLIVSCFGKSSQGNTL